MIIFFIFTQLIFGNNTYILQGDQLQENQHLEVSRGGKTARFLCCFCVLYGNSFVEFFSLLYSSISHFSSFVSSSASHFMFLLTFSHSFPSSRIPFLLLYFHLISPFLPIIHKCYYTFLFFSLPLSRLAHIRQPLREIIISIDNVTKCKLTDYKHTPPF